MSNPVIYTITSIYFATPDIPEPTRAQFEKEPDRYLPLKQSWKEYSDRIFGYYPTFEEAEAAVKKNLMNMHECLYNLLVIEEVRPGIHPICEKEWWYHWDYSRDEWKPIDEKPKAFAGLINFGIG